MPKTLHPSARTTPAIRKAIQKSNLTIQALANKYAISQGKVLKWKHRETVEDRKPGPTSPRSTSLSPQEEAMVIAFRKDTLLPLEDCLYTLKKRFPTLHTYLYIDVFKGMKSIGFPNPFNLK